MARQRRTAAPPADLPLPRPVSGLLTPEHCASLQDCLRQAGDTQAILDCLAACGIDMSHVQAELQANTHIASGLLHFFGPDQNVSGM